MLFASLKVINDSNNFELGSCYFMKSDMGENSFGLCSSYFESLRDKACKIDNGIDKLSNIWNTPHLLIGGYGERSVEIDAHLDELWKSIRNTNDAMKQSRIQLESSLEETNQFLKETQTSYKDLKAKCDNIDTVLAEYGYHYEEHKDSTLESDYSNGNKDYTDESILNSKEVEVEFTPDLTWKCKPKLSESGISKLN